jgi:CheY-like chemotaxis protein
VRLYFPRATKPDAAEVLREDLPVVGGHEHVLVVEDDALVREHAVALLLGLGYRVTCAADGAEALEILRGTEPVDLLFTDVVMPGGLNGRELADAAQVLRPGLKVLYTSGYTENAIVHHGRLDRGVQLLGKPYRRQQLAQKVRAVLDAPGTLTSR